MSKRAANTAAGLTYAAQCIISAVRHDAPHCRLGRALDVTLHALQKEDAKSYIDAYSTIEHDLVLSNVGEAVRCWMPGRAPMSAKDALLTASALLRASGDILAATADDLDDDDL